MTSTDYAKRIVLVTLGELWVGECCSIEHFLLLKIPYNDWWCIILINRGKFNSNISIFLSHQKTLKYIASRCLEGTIHIPLASTSTLKDISHEPLTLCVAVFIRPWGTLGPCHSSGMMENFWINSLDSLPLHCNNGDWCSICSHVVLQWGWALGAYCDNLFDDTDFRNLFLFLVNPLFSFNCCLNKLLTLEYLFQGTLLWNLNQDVYIGSYSNAKIFSNCRNMGRMYNCKVCQ